MKKHGSMATNIRNSYYYQYSTLSFEIEDVDFFPNTAQHPILFDEMS
jgi:hypothetical protein